VPRFRLVTGSDGEIAISITAARGKTMAPLTSPHPTEISTDAPTEEPLAPGDVYYVGRRTSLGQAVLVEHDDDERALPISDGGRGYSWGTAGSKPVELARGILFDATADEQLAAQLCKAFTWEVIGLLPADFFRLGRSEVLAWLEDYRFDFPVPAGLRSRRLDGATTRTGRVVQQRPRPGTMRAGGSKVAVKLD
jgi:hypothetical protein